MKTPPPFRPGSPLLQTLVTRLGLGLTAAVLLLLATVMVLHAIDTRRRDLAAEMQVAASIIGANSAAAISFGNAGEANEILQSLQAWPDVIEARLYLPDGGTFGRYRSSTPSACPGLSEHAEGMATAAPRPWQLSRCAAVVSSPVMLHGRAVGQVTLLVGLDSAYRAIGTTLVIAAVGAVLAFAVAAALWRKLAARVARPLIELLRVSERVGRERDFGLRSRAGGVQEVEALSDAFNRMMDELQQHDAAVHHELATGREANERLGGLAYIDAVTGLHNRHYFNEHLDRVIAGSEGEAGHCALIYLDLDGFKQVNDRMGHDVGDVLLREVGRRLTGCLRRNDGVCRLGGDEFAVIVEGHLSPARLETIAATIVAEVGRPYTFGEWVPRVSASVGACLFPDHAGDRDALIQRADAAMYRAKQAGKNRYCLADAGQSSSPAPNSGNSTLV
jgi:diguanylate cyclase (GGDEF)-like protein